jgi:hypothetical protein
LYADKDKPWKGSFSLVCQVTLWLHTNLLLFVSTLLWLKVGLETLPLITIQD